MIEVAGGDTCHLDDVLVAPVTGHGQHHDLAAADLVAIDHVADHLHRRRVVCVVEDHLERMLVVDVEATGDWKKVLSKVRRPWRMLSRSIPM
jgi:hypothetical protein